MLVIMAVHKDGETSAFPVGTVLECDELPSTIGKGFWADGTLHRIDNWFQSPQAGAYPWHGTTHYAGNNELYDYDVYAVIVEIW